MTNLNNWTMNKLGTNKLSANDKLKQLLKRPEKLVLVQQHELELIRSKNNSEKREGYIDLLYQHYIVEGKGKTYNG